MHRTLLKSKIHRARVTEADLDYIGSVSIDPVLLEGADIREYEQVEIYDVTSGSRLSTYAIEGSPGEICINGAAAHLVRPDDLVIICSYASYSEEEARSHRPKVLLVDEENRVLERSDSVQAGATYTSMRP